MTEVTEMKGCTEIAGDKKTTEVPKMERDQEGEFRRFVPTSECMEEAFQMDAFGNFRICVKGKESEWVGYERIAILDIDGEKFIGVSAYFEGYLPTECILRVEAVDEEGESNFFKCKIVDTEEDIILDSDDVEEILRDPTFDDEDYIYIVKKSSQKDFVKIKIISYDDSISGGKCLTSEEIIDVLIDAFAEGKYDIYDRNGNIINT